jgi:hypothetical protein
VGAGKGNKNGKRKKGENVIKEIKKMKAKNVKIHIRLST